MVCRKPLKRQQCRVERFRFESWFSFKINCPSGGTVDTLVLGTRYWGFESLLGYDSRTGLPDMSSLIGQKDWSPSRLQNKIRIAQIVRALPLKAGDENSKPLLIYLLLTHKWWCTGFVTQNRASSILARSSLKCECRITAHYSWLPIKEWGFDSLHSLKMALSSIG